MPDGLSAAHRIDFKIWIVLINPSSPPDSATYADSEEGRCLEIIAGTLGDPPAIVTWAQFIERAASPVGGIRILIAADDGELLSEATLVMLLAEVSRLIASHYAELITNPELLSEKLFRQKSNRSGRPPTN